MSCRCLECLISAGRTPSGRDLTHAFWTAVSAFGHRGAKESLRRIVPLDMGVIQKIIGEPGETVDLAITQTTEVGVVPTIKRRI